MKFTDALTWARENPGRELSAWQKLSAEPGDKRPQQIRWHEASLQRNWMDFWAGTIICGWMLDADWQIVPEKREEGRPAKAYWSRRLKKNVSYAGGIKLVNVREGIVDVATRDEGDVEAGDMLDAYRPEIPGPTTLEPWTITPSPLAKMEMPGAIAPGTMFEPCHVGTKDRLADAERVIDLVISWLASGNLKIDELDAYRAKWPKGPQ